MSLTCRMTMWITAGLSLVSHRVVNASLMYHTQHIVLKQLRNDYIPVDEYKLDVLCTKNPIPSVHHSFFKDLHHLAAFKCVWYRFF